MGMVSRLAAAFGTTPSAIVAESNMHEGGTTVGPATLALHTLADASSNTTGTAHTIEVPVSVLMRHPHARAALMADDAMDRVIPLGMAIVFDPDLEPTSGSIAIVEYADQTIVRRLYRGNGTILLVADSHQAHDDVVLTAGDGARLLGTVVWAQCPRELV